MHKFATSAQLKPLPPHPYFAMPYHARYSAMFPHPLVRHDRQLQTSRKNSQLSQGQQQRGHQTYYTAKPVRRCCRKKNQSPSALARSRKRHTCFLEKKLAGKPDLALPEEKSITTVPGFPDAVDSLCVKELENTSPVGGSSRDLVSLEDPTSSPDSDPDLS